MAQDEKRALWYIKKIPLFQDVSHDTIHKLVQCVELKEVRRRQVVYLPGDPGQAVYFVNGGRVKISKVTRDGKELTLAYRGPGEIFGELVMIDGGPREEMAEAMENALITEIDRAEFEKIVQKEGVIGFRLTKIVAQRRRDVENKIEQLIFKDVNAKLAELLLRLAAEYGVDDSRGTLVSLKITHQEMANLIGSTRETVSLTLSQFKRKGLIQTEGRKVILADREGCGRSPELPVDGMAPLLKLGELLVEAGAITRPQLSDALSHQRQYGGRLGTCLVELGLVDDKQLATILAKQLTIPSATASQMEKSEATALKLLPPALAERFRAVPIRIDGDKLWVVMADPTDKQALGELSKASGKKIRPMVAPELLVQYALERHYKVKRKPRVVQVRTGGSDLLKIDAPRSSSPLGSPLPPPPPKDAPSEAPIYSGFGSGPLKIDVDSLAGYLDDQPEQPVATSNRIPMEQISAMLVAATSDDAIFDVAMRYVEQDVGRLAVFLLRNGLLGGWRGQGIDNALLRQLNVGLEEAPIIARTLAGGEAWVGRLYSAELGALAKPLGAAREGLGVVLPVRIGKRAVGAVVGLDATLNVLRFKSELDRLAVKLDQALHISYLRRLLMQP